MKLIDKDALVAEIERRRDAALMRQKNLESIGQESVINEMVANELNRIISFDNYSHRFGLRIYAVVNHLDSLKHRFYYTRDGHSVSSMFSSSGLDGIVKFFKQEITSIPDVYIDRIYGSYRVNNFKLL